MMSISLKICALTTHSRTIFIENKKFIQLEEEKTIKKSVYCNWSLAIEQSNWFLEFLKLLALVIGYKISTD